MKTISNIKKTALSLLVVGLALGFSAFKSVETSVNEDARFATANYGYNATTGLYQLISGPVDVVNNCAPSTGKCAVIYSYPTTTPPTTPPSTLNKSTGDGLPLYPGAASNRRYF